MALVLADRVQQTGTASGTTSFTLSGSVNGFQSFAVVGNGNTTYYSAFDASGNWEVGVGTYATGGTLTRTTIISSSNSGSAVTFSGTVDVFVTYPSGKAVNQDASGNVGIGVSPSYKLDVLGVINARSATVANIQLYSTNAADQTNTIGSYYNSGAGFSQLNHSASFYTWGISGTEKMRIDSGGNVGIGTNSPGALLDVNGQMQAKHIDAAGFAYRAVANAANTLGQIQWTNNAGTSDWAYLNSTGQNLSTWRTAIGDTTYPSSANLSINGGVVNMRKVAAGGGDIGDWPNPVLGLQNYDSNFNGITMIIMGGKDDDTSYQTGSAVWNWRLWNTGGTTWTTSSASTMCSLSGPGTLTMSSSTNGVQLTSGATAWVAYSDERMKDIIEPITDAAEKVSTLRAVIGKYKTDETGTRRPMLIAQDVQAVLPEAVVETAYMPNNNDLTKPVISEQRLALAYTEVIPLLVAAIKEQQEVIKQLQADVAELKANSNKVI